MPLTIPNLLTLLRLFAAPAVALVFVVVPRPAADAVAVTLFLSASLTDFLDGWIARRWNQQSEFGRMLDPIADKAMVTIALAVLMMLTGLDPWLLVPASAIFLRETAVSGLREHLAGRVSIPVTKLAKWKTTVQMVAIGALFLQPWGEWARVSGLALIWVAAALTVITGWDYFRRGLASSAMKEGS
ncbi:CDP-diacylglycerol--glycerol-3-phosphate 3-phosphatidyltransferase [uncultured Albimonas sp.]|uniref:CDP-diacylglycerol--glycerol-3-phosphate 3-phosphatidyltransferase n=1 Tax=uncultured Albimonas sp. TaxID=1331701 RepID=UPI0030EF7CF4|tara:strand:+ start:6227 stop:6784 length:558 start_codon:yes stop_codon:yes gene_type:complete